MRKFDDKMTCKLSLDFKIDSDNRISQTEPMAAIV